MRLLLQVVEGEFERVEDGAANGGMSVWVPRIQGSIWGSGADVLVMECIVLD